MKTLLKYTSGKLEGYNIKTDGNSFYAFRNRTRLTIALPNFMDADNWIRDVNSMERCSPVIKLK